MKKLLFIIGVVLALVGCENDGVDINGRAFADYPVAGRSYVEEKYGGTELHFAKKGNKLKEIVFTEAGIKLQFDMHYVMVSDTIHTYYNTTEFDTIGMKYIYHDTYLTSYYGDDYRLNEI